MKLFTKLFFILFLLATVPVIAQLQEENIQLLYQADEQSLLIEPGRSFEQAITFAKKDYPVHRSLRVVGSVQMPGKFAPRGEEFFRQAEFLIDDCLDSLNTFRDKYSLYFKGSNDPFERHAYNRITGVPLSKGKLTVETVMRNNRLKTSSGEIGRAHV